MRVSVGSVPALAKFQCGWLYPASIKLFLQCQLPVGNGVQDNVSAEQAGVGGSGFSSLTSWTFSVLSLDKFLEEKSWAGKWTEILGMTSAFKEAHLQCMKCTVLTPCRMGFMKPMSHVRENEMLLAATCIRRNSGISPVEASCNLLVGWGGVTALYLPFYLGHYAYSLASTVRFEKQIKHP